MKEISYGHAKLTLHLKVEKEVRKDGYHNVQILSIPLNLKNKITITKNDTIEIKTNNQDIPTDKSSIVWKTAKLMLDRFPNKVKPVRINIEEDIPVSAGLGGAAADAAATLKAINKMFNLGLSLEDLMTIGIELGSDVPLCLFEKPAIVRGKGDIIEPVNLRIDYPIVLLTPKKRVMKNKTVIAYKTFDVQKDLIPEIPDVDEVYKDGRVDFSKLANTFEYLNCDYLKESLKLINKFVGLPFVIHVGLAGAGPTVYLILKDNFNVILDNNFQVINTEQLPEVETSISSN